MPDFPFPNLEGAAVHLFAIVRWRMRDKVAQEDSQKAQVINPAETLKVLELINSGVQFDQAHPEP